MPTNIYMNVNENDADMIIEHSNGSITILPFDTAVAEGIPAIAAYMGETFLEVSHHFEHGAHLQIDDDALCIPHIIR